MCSLACPFVAHIQKKVFSHDMTRYAFFQFQKNGRDFEKLGKALQPDELTATLGLMTLEQKHLYLEKAFEEHLDMYSPVIERLAID